MFDKGVWGKLDGIQRSCVNVNKQGYERSSGMNFGPCWDCAQGCEGTCRNTCADGCQKACQHAN